jgi:SAM-dependent methyltransferase
VSEQATGHGHGHNHGHGHDITPEQAAEMFTERAWEERYRSSEQIWSGAPNPQLVAEAAGLTPGTAVDVGCGEGADAIWLAGRGWRVTGVDFATAALGRAAAHAAPLGLEIDWVHSDVTAWDPGAARFDLVSAQFMHLPPEPRAALFARLAGAVAPGGTLLIVGHDLTDLDTDVPRTPIPERFFTAAEVAATLDPDRWEIVAAERRPRTTLDPEGHEATIHDAVLNARRR